MKALIEKSKDHNIKLIFVLSARHVYKNLLSLCNELPGDHFIDMGNPNELNFAYEYHYTFDRGHLNEIGADKYSIVFAKKLLQILNKK